MAESGASALTPTPRPPASHSSLARAEQFVWLTARVLEQRLFAYHFRGGDAGPVETALDAYRNEDGGYGHGLEPDLRGPVSRPPHTARALRVLDAVGRCGGQRVERMCRYLTSASTPDGALPAVRPGLRGDPAVPSVPAAPFVPVVDDPPGELLATGPVVGLLHRNEVWHAWLFRATDFCWRAAESLETSDPYEVEAAVAFLDTVPDRPRAEVAAGRLGSLVRAQRLAVLDPDDLGTYPVSAGQAPGEHHFPHDYARHPHSLARAWFTDAEMTRSLDFLAAEQEDDGGWPLRRPRRAPAPALEARPAVTLEALRTLRAYGRVLG
ncbi:hypothetical protein ACFWR9_28360 [Streptomyces sp. NPDC058534]|uniref:hypothetical protein n=1 Tax=Streptomyces sp. NPDC058534 TaxID=3346541 RepID=UPI00366097D7